MVKRSTHLRCGSYFEQYTRELRKRTGMNTPEITDNLARFLEREKLTGIFENRAREHQRRREKRFFL